jgi:hypothetical protein
MTLKFKKRTTAVVLVALSVVGSGAAYAYWTGAGSGSGSAAVASSAGTVTLTATVAGPAIIPGATRAVTFKGSNAGTSNLTVGTIHLDSITVDTPHAACAVADFSMADVTSGTVVAAGTTDVTLTGTGSLVFEDTLVNQNACKGAALTLHLSSN